MGLSITQKFDDLIALKADPLVPFFDGLTDWQAGLLVAAERGSTHDSLNMPTESRSRSRPHGSFVSPADAPLPHTHDNTFC